MDTLTTVQSILMITLSMISLTCLLVAICHLCYNFCHCTKTQSVSYNEISPDDDNSEREESSTVCTEGNEEHTQSKSMKYPHLESEEQLSINTNKANKHRCKSNKKQITSKHDTNKFVFYPILWILCSDIPSPAANIVQYLKPTLYINGIDYMCPASSFVRTTGFLASILFVLNAALLATTKLICSLRGDNIQHRKTPKCCSIIYDHGRYILIWILSFGIASIPIVYGGYGHVNYWCWIQHKDKIMHTKLISLCFYLPLILVCIGLLILIIIISFQKIYNGIEIIKELKRHQTWFIFGLMIVWIFPSVRFAVNMANKTIFGNDNIDLVVHIMTGPTAHGYVDAILYYLFMQSRCKRRHNLKNNTPRNISNSLQMTQQTVVEISPSTK